MDETTTIDVDQVQEWKHADDPVTVEPKDAPETPSIGSHPAPDNDPYGWIAGVESGHPDHIESSIGEQVVVRPEHVVVWTHGYPEPDKFDRAVAKVLPNGTLLVTYPKSDIPLKGYAPGVWLTFEHVGDQYQPPQRLQTATGGRMGRSVPPVQMTNYMTQAGAPIDTATAALMTDPMRRTPPTAEQDADDTETIPAVVEVGTYTRAKTRQPESEADGVGGGVERPKAAGVRADAGSDGVTPRPSGDAPDEPDEEPTPGRIRSLWKYLTDPDWVKD